ncbi:MAG: hypothetical protein OXF48_10280, partial [Bacteroidetes bacterium]|nr:hypothetical protein [Bacteroidota bacterium]
PLFSDRKDLLRFFQSNVYVQFRGFCKRCQISTFGWQGECIIDDPYRVHVTTLQSSGDNPYPRDVHN